MPVETVERLIDLLDEEKTLLLKGRIEDVAALEPAKLQLSGELEEQARPDDATLARLQDKVRRNQVLLEAAGKGLQSAGARLKEIRKVMMNLDTYTRSGNLQNLQQTPPKVERRA